MRHPATGSFQAGGGLLARVVRSASVLVFGYGASQGLRLASNLILTRLLFPEAFGFMTLITIVTTGLAMFSDVGITPSISQSARGDDPEFLNTAWTIQIIRGFGLWAAACLLALPVASFYGEPDLAFWLPVAAVTLVIAGFNPTRIDTAARHLLLGRVTTLDLIAQGIGLVVMIVLAYAMRSVAALVIGGIVTALAKLILTSLLLPGQRNRLRWERPAAAELFGFGKWIFLSTGFYFISSQGDRAILGKFLSLEALGLYNIGYFLASFPILLGHSVTSKMLIPIYRACEAGGEGAERQLRRMRFALSAGLMAMMLVMAYAGPWLVDLLYDERYARSGAMLVLIACAMLPQVVGASYDYAALAAGDSRSFFILAAARAATQIGFLLLGVSLFGLIGAIGGMAVATVLVHPVLIWLARRHGAWHGVHDLLTALTGAALATGALWLHRDLIGVVAAMG